MNSAEAYFQAGRYNNEMLFIGGIADTLQIGMKNSRASALTG